MFPIRDDNPHFLTPWVTWVIVGLNVVLWLVVQGAGRAPALPASVCTLGLVPGELLGTLAAGAAMPIGHGMACVTTAEPNPLTLLSHMFLHGSWMHLLGNLWFLWIFGNNVEDSMGHARFVAFYLLCGLAAATAQILADPSSGIPMVGASGAIGGVMGAYVVLYPRVNVHMLFWFGFYVTTFAIPALWMLGYWFVLQMVGGLGSLGAQGGGVAFWAHVGGFVAGAALIFVFKNPRLLARHPCHGWSARSSQPYRRLR
ncbi:MAG: rhomboid family intramembrane serine protease [Gammaproteobacteria bacterium]